MTSERDEVERFLQAARPANQALCVTRLMYLAHKIWLIAGFQIRLLAQIACCLEIR